MAKDYTLSVPQTTKLKVGERAKIVATLEGPGPYTVNKPNTSDDLIQLRFSVNPQLVRVVGVKMLQEMDHATPKEHHRFAWMWTGRLEEKNPEANLTVTTRTFVASEYLDEGPGDPAEIEIPFDVQVGPLFEIEVEGVKAGQMQLNIVSAWLASSGDTSTKNRDGYITVTS